MLWIPTQFWLDLNNCSHLLEEARYRGAPCHSVVELRDGPTRARPGSLIKRICSPTSKRTADTARRYVRVISHIPHYSVTIVSLENSYVPIVL